MANLIMTTDYILPVIKEILPFTDGTDIYDTKLMFLIKAGISKLETEGLKLEALRKNGDYFFGRDTNEGYDYIMCLSYQIMKDMDFDVDMGYMTEQYITRIGALRLKLATL